MTWASVEHILLWGVVGLAWLAGLVIAFGLVTRVLEVVGEHLIDSYFEQRIKYLEFLMEVEKKVGGKNIQFN